MTTIAFALWKHWNTNRAAQVQVQIRGVPPVRGPLQCLNEREIRACGDVEAAGLPVPIFELETEVQEGQQVYILPITFAADDVAWYSAGPRTRPAIIAPSGGLHVGGQNPSA